MPKPLIESHDPLLARRHRRHITAALLVQFQLETLESPLTKLFAAQAVPHAQIVLYPTCSSPELFFVQALSRKKVDEKFALQGKVCSL